MTIDEQELGRQLARTADLASAPRLDAGELTRRAGRRRRRISSAAFAAVAAVAAVAVIVPTALGGRTQTGTEDVPPPPAVRPSYAVTVNGRTQAGGGTANFVIKPGEKLAITVRMTIPARTSVTVTGLWLGIADDLLEPTRNGPLHMAPIFVADRHISLGPGTYTWALHWVAPAGLRPGGGRQLCTELIWPDAAVEGIIAQFNVPDNEPSN